jgi:hypothetical protein
MELASGIGFPPPLGTSEDYHFFFKNVKFLFVLDLFPIT